jgi:hypothetical protein
MAGSFDSLYGAWLERGGGHNLTVEPELIKLYRGAWESGDTRVRGIVLNFIMLRPHPEGFDLVGRSLVTNDPALAPHAAAIAFTLIGRGFDLGPRIRKELEEFRMRFPDWAEVSTVTLEALDNVEKRKARRRSRED